MKIVPNKELVYAHPYSRYIILLLDAVFSYLESYVDHAPFGFCIDESHCISNLIFDGINESYQDYLHRVLSKDAYCGMYGVWVTVTRPHKKEQDMVVLYSFFQTSPFPFLIYVPHEESETWWAEPFPERI